MSNQEQVFKEIFQANSKKIYHKLNGGRLFGKVWTIKLPLDKDIADLQGKLGEYEKIQLD